MQVPNQEQQAQSQGAHEQHESNPFSLQSPHLAQATRDIRDAVPLDIVTPNAGRSSVPKAAEPGADPASAPSVQVPSHSFGAHNRAATIASSTLTLPGDDVEPSATNGRSVLPQIGGFGESSPSRHQARLISPSLHVTEPWPCTDPSSAIGLDNNGRFVKDDDTIGPGDTSTHGLARPASYPQLSASVQHLWENPLQQPQQFLAESRSSDNFKAPVSPSTQRNPGVNSSRSAGGAIRSRPPLLQKQSRAAPYSRARHPPNSPFASASEFGAFEERDVSLPGAIGGANAADSYGNPFHPGPGPLSHGYFGPGEPAYSHGTGDLHQTYASNAEPTGSVYAYPGTSTFGHTHLYHATGSSSQNYAFGSQAPQQARFSGDYDLSAELPRRNSGGFSATPSERQQQLFAAMRSTHQSQTQGNGPLSWTPHYQTTHSASASASGSQPRYPPYFQSHPDAQLPIPGPSHELFQPAFYGSDVNGSVVPFQPQPVDSSTRLGRRYSDQRNDSSSSPSFIRASQLAPGAISPSAGFSALGHPFGASMPGLPAQPPIAVLNLHTNLRELAHSWDEDEYARKRRLVQFFRTQEGSVIHVEAKPIKAAEYRNDIPTISCIYREDKNDCFLTSVDAISLLESLIGGRGRFSIEEKNRIRRNLEGFRPITISKNKRETAEFFSLIMSFPEPKPRNIEKDVKVFAWNSLSEALKKIVTKYIVLPDGALNANELS